jgi:hypothetical protein
VAVAWAATAAAETGSAQLTGRSILAVKGCGKERASLVLRVVVNGDTTWTGEDEDGARFAGTYAVRAPSSRKLELAFDETSAAAFVTAAAEDIAVLCEAPVTVASVERRKFILRLNRKRTKAALVLLYRLIGSAAGESGSARYRVAAKGPWTAGS